jgi:hypothetical protein
MEKDRQRSEQIQDLPVNAEQAAEVKGGIIVQKSLIDPNVKSFVDPNDKSVIDPNF